VAIHHFVVKIGCATLNREELRQKLGFFRFRLDFLDICFWPCRQQRHEPLLAAWPKRKIKKDREIDGITIFA
jgi:hypothetical protein